MSPEPALRGAQRPGHGTAPDLARVRGALARGAGLGRALSEGAASTTGATGIASLTRLVHADVDGAGAALTPLLEAEGVTDVLVGGGMTWIDRGSGLEPVPQARLDEPEARALAVRMAASAGRRLDDAAPIVDATLPDGTRLNAVLPPLSADGTLICLRTKRRRAFTLPELVEAGTIAPGLDRILAALVERRASCLITGATGTGKTTLLAALLGLVPADERIVCIEEASELAPDHPHVIHLQERGDNVQGVGAVPMTALVRTALRMRPDRIVLGECRGPEVRDVLTALNTGHEGGWATLHANSPADVPARLTALGALAGLDEIAVAAQAGSALDAVIHLRREADPSGARRRVSSLGLLSRERDGRLACHEALRIQPDGAMEAAAAHEGLLALTGGAGALAGGARGAGEGS
ncbi:TadA family conjugal transfer-associated ATPase [Actinomyces sp. zg296]|uniref:TadA family conjugal transfer-associated ATPase n=1 Tax=Actinomyces sp. zg296 TaxID=2609289 RepID=UPI0013584192|nr:TadA family conjugal transfer-associated ATPase [Actinomyces sp. zg296]